MNWLRRPSSYFGGVIGIGWFAFQHFCELSFAAASVLAVFLMLVLCAGILEGFEIGRNTGREFQ